MLSEVACVRWPLGVALGACYEFPRSTVWAQQCRACVACGDLLSACACVCWLLGMTLGAFAFV